MKGYIAFLIFCLINIPILLNAQADENLYKGYIKREVMIPMRDGVKLYTIILEPIDKSVKSPILMTRSPYYWGKGKDLNKLCNIFRYNYLAHNYILVLQNVRGKLLSEGSYENVRPYIINKKRKTTDESTDAYDTVDWLIHNTNNNGNVGVLGISYNGFYASQAALCGHPAIKAVSPQAPVTDFFMGDDVHKNGAFQYSICDFGISFFRNREKPDSLPMPPIFNIDKKDDYKYYLGKGSISNVFKDFGDSLKFFNDIKSHPNYDNFWVKRNVSNYFDNVKPAMLVVGGLYDREDLYGTLLTYKKLRELSPDNETYLVLGPWFHGYWILKGNNKFGDVSFGSGSARYFLDKIEYPFFAKYLENKPCHLPKVQYLPSQETIPSKMRNVNTDNLWKTAINWPIDNVIEAKLYLHRDRTLSYVAPKSRNAYLTYHSNPNRPIPVSANLSSFSQEAIANQNFLVWRADLLTFEGPILKDTMRVVGSINVNLNVSISSTDADIIVKIIDERPDGYQMLVRWGVLPLRYRYSFASPTPVIPGQVMNIFFPLDDIAHYFLPGHHLIVQIQSSLFPWIAMNTQNYMTNPYEATKRDYKQADVTIYCQKNAKSYIQLPLLQN